MKDFIEEKMWNPASFKHIKEDVFSSEQQEGEITTLPFPRRVTEGCQV